MPARERSNLLLEAANRLEREAEAIACLSSLETGNAIATQTRGEARTMVDILRFFAGMASVRSRGANCGICFSNLPRTA